jgi:hypothetical protein
MSDYFQKYGGKNPITEKSADPTNCCLEGMYLNCPENPWRFEAGLCQQFMGQRCARTWDNKCDLYLEQQGSADFTGKKSSNFLFEAFTSKYCRDDTTDPNNKCYTRCEMMNPLSPAGAVVCKSYGNNAYRKIDDLQAVSTNFLSDARLDSTSPLYVHKCPKTCDILSLNDFGEDNRLLNEVLDRGVAQAGLMNLAENVVKNSIPVTNTRFLNFISKYIADKQQGSVANNITPLLGKTNNLSTIPFPTPMPSFLGTSSNDVKPSTTPSLPNVNLPLNLEKSQREGFRQDGATSPENTFPIYGYFIILAFILLILYLAKEGQFLNFMTVSSLTK